MSAYAIIYFTKCRQKQNAKPFSDSAYNDPNEIRTRVTAVKGRCLNRLTMGPRSLFVPEAHIHETGKIKTPRVGLEPTTQRLTAVCSTD